MELPTFDRLDEAGLRKPGFRAGTPIRLMDGQEWTFANPIVMGSYPVANPDGTFTARVFWEFGQAYDRAFDRWLEDGTHEQLWALAYLLLSQNYELRPESMAGLLIRPIPSHPRRAEYDAIIAALAEVAVGKAPKPTDGGGDSPSSSTESPNP